jgi:hypothetical protein
MKKLACVLVILSLLLPLTIVQKEKTTIAEASPDVFEGDLILSDDNVTVLEKA